MDTLELVQGVGRTRSRLDILLLVLTGTEFLHGLYDVR